VVLSVDEVGALLARLDRSGRFQSCARSARKLTGIAITPVGSSITASTAASARSFRTSAMTLLGRRARAACPPPRSRRPRRRAPQSPRIRDMGRAARRRRARRRAALRVAPRAAPRGRVAPQARRTRVAGLQV
jgi:hypothetical protein